MPLPGSERVNTEKSGSILGFNGLRGLSVVLVYLNHKCGLQFYSGSVGVWIFFILSGFLIIGELNRQRGKVGTAASRPAAEIVTFWVKRATRIFPAYYALLAILFLTRSYFQHAGPDLGFRYHVVYLSNYWIGSVIGGTAGPFGVLWTLSVEQQFYVIAPFLFILLPLERHFAICMSVVVLGVISHFLMYSSGFNHTAIHTLSPWNFSLIAFGGALTILHLQRREWAPNGNGTFVCLLIVGVMLCSNGVIYDAPSYLSPAIDIAIGLCLVALIWWVRANQDSIFVQALEWKPLEHLGKISYGFYLVHNFIPNPLGKALTLYGGMSVPDSVKITAGAAIGFVISYGVAHVSWKYFESPILHSRRGLTKFFLQYLPENPSQGVPRTELK
ncbi:acyltransferase [Bradyrhizobium barranii subsp. barranii]|uniref:Acyltransferase n=1 Tax=Bradyrhizobium barranii subsp. barranii TaxID=2823807 RepID=A0A7Z0QEL5_9BRAD|nr:acyltransferase [Bradyrhizobium barranii]UGX92003.1 acyltransferase [Bradyrhizobium barranii subsp. barranii]